MYPRKYDVKISIPYVFFILVYELQFPTNLYMHNILIQIRDKNNIQLTDWMTWINFFINIQVKGILFPFISNLGGLCVFNNAWFCVIKLIFFLAYLISVKIWS